MVENTARESIPGSDPHLPAFIVDRMKVLGLKPTLKQLSLGSGTPISTMRDNLNGSRAMKLETALKMATFLECDLSELVKQASLR